MDATDCHDGWHHINNAWGALNVGVNFNVARNFYLEAKLHILIMHHQRRPRPFLNRISCHNAQRPLQLLAQPHRHTLRPLRNRAVISHMMPKYHDSYNQTYFAYQFSPLGAQVGISRSATIFGELGLAHRACCKWASDSTCNYLHFDYVCNAAIGWLWREHRGRIPLYGHCLNDCVCYETIILPFSSIRPRRIGGIKKKNQDDFVSLHKPLRPVRLSPSTT